MNGGRIIVLAWILAAAVGCDDDEPAAPEPSEEELEAEELRLADEQVLEALRSGDIRALSDYLRTYPDGAHVAEAREALSAKVPEQMIVYRREAARLGSDPLLVLAAVDVFEAFADQAPAALHFETVTDHGSAPDGVPTPHSVDEAYQSVFEPERLNQYTSDNEAAVGLAAATNYLFTAADPEFHDDVLGDEPLFRIVRGVVPSDTIITADDGQAYRSLTANVRTEVHVPAHDGRPARVAHREDSRTPTSFGAEFTQVQGLGSTNDATRHRAVYDALLTEVGSTLTHGPAGRLAFYRRPQDYAAAVDLPIPQQYRALDAVITKLDGTIPGVEVGTRCRLQVGRGDPSGPLGCRLGFVCAGHELYGHERSGFVPCGSPPVIVNDEDPNDGDPSIRIDTNEEKLVFRDIASGRFGEVSLEASVFATDEPTPQVPTAPAEAE
jgi:hypothetical protein